MINHTPFPLRWIAASLLALAATPVLAQTYEGRVTHVLAADTVRLTVVTTCLEAGCPELGDSLRVALSEIDAPELDQPHGETATEALLKRIHERVVTVIQERTDDRGRPVGHLYLEDEWLNGWAVSEGYAWVHPPTAETAALDDLQRVAEAQERGLWGDDAPVAPWRWREGIRDATSTAETTQQPGDAPHDQLSPAAIDGAITLETRLNRGRHDG